VAIRLFGPHRAHDSRPRRGRRPINVFTDEQVCLERVLRICHRRGQEGCFDWLYSRVTRIFGNGPTCPLISRSKICTALEARRSACAAGAMHCFRVVCQVALCVGISVSGWAAASILPYGGFAVVSCALAMALRVPFRISPVRFAVFAIRCVFAGNGKGDVLVATRIAQC